MGIITRTLRAGWKNAYSGALAPRCMYLKEEKLEALGAQLFYHVLHLFSSNLRGLYDTLLASVVMYLPDVIRDCGDDNLLVKYVMDASRRAEVDYSTLVLWSF
jgi:hypothetical protein